MSPRRVTPKMQSPIYGRIRQILESDTSPRKSLGLNISDAVRRESLIRYVPRTESWQPGLLHPNLSWTRYRILFPTPCKRPLDPVS